MKIKVLLAIVVCSAIILGAVLASGAGAAEYTGTVMPVVDVDPGGSLAITGITNPPNLIEFGHMGPGESLSRTFHLNITSNEAWRVKVHKDRDLTEALGSTIPPAELTFSSSGPEGPTYAADAQIGFSSSATNVVTGGTVSTTGVVDVIYTLNVPATQEPGRYTATHTYTLITGP